jgi:putative heme-binding domain-containing protein
LDIEVSRTFTTGSAQHDALWKKIVDQAGQGHLNLKTQLNLADVFHPAVQPGSKLDYDLPLDEVFLNYDASAGKATRLPDGAKLKFAKFTGGSLGIVTYTPKRGQWDLIEFSVSPSVTDGYKFSFGYGGERHTLRQLPLHRALVPWADTKADIGKPVELPRPKELDGGSWARGRKVYFSETAACFKCHAVHAQGGAIGPDLTNLIHRDYPSVMRDITQPSIAINPDFITYTVRLKDERTLLGVVKTVEGKLHIGDKDGKTTIIDKNDVAEMRPSPLSVMPDDLVKKLGPDQTRDLLTFLLTPAPSMPRDYVGGPRPKPRTMAEVNAALAGAPNPPEKTRPIRVVLVAGPKDHAKGEHDYPAWQKAWAELLSASDNIEVVTAMEWPERAEFQKADVMVFYQRGTWNAKRAADIDAFLERGGGLVYIHWAVDGGTEVAEFAKRIGLAAHGGKIKFRHGPLELDFKDVKHPITRNFGKLNLVDESYWMLTGDLPKERVLGWGTEEKEPGPLFWSLEKGKGRVFVSIPGHYSWSFDDPLFRILLLRGIAWTAKEPVDRFNDLVWPGADVVK